jgi:transcriptional regulator with XRE-family HTH domain
MSKVGKHLREMRRRRNLPMRELAIRSGISHSTISLIERDRISPTVDTLGAILDALGTTLPGFFSGIHSAVPASPFYPVQDSIEIGNSDSVSYRMIGVNFPNRQLLLLRETYAPGADSGEAFAHNAQEAGIVITGAVEVTVGDQTRVLLPGDGYYFDSRQSHRFRNVDGRPSEIVSAVTPPTY